MDNIILRQDLYPIANDNTTKEEIIALKKEYSYNMKKINDLSKQDRCYYCGKQCESFCNSHSIPAFILKNIASNGQIYNNNTILEMANKGEQVGINSAGTFRLLCNNCDSIIFNTYETPNNHIGKPNNKMLSEIHIKNSLKYINQKLLDVASYETILGPIINDLNTVEHQIKNIPSFKELIQFDLDEALVNFELAKKNYNSVNPNYNLNYFIELPYTLPIAFQGLGSLYFDLKQDIINNPYIKDNNYKIEYVNICVFPFKETSNIYFFTTPTNKRYRNFFKQLAKLSLEEQLKVINYIILTYCEHYFLSKTIPKEILSKLKCNAGTSTTMLTLEKKSISQSIEIIRQDYNFSNIDSLPNLFSEEFKL